MAIKRRKGHIRTGEAIPVKDIIHLLKDIQSDGNQYILVKGDPVKITSQRYAVFQKSLVCKDCSLVGSIFYKEKSHPSHKSYHLNLYAINKRGQEILMTKDHRVPKSKGGPNTLSNYDTMCTRCNCKKGDKLK
jgi:5-methylcytosine-specific restriction endonuclease McrA